MLVFENWGLNPKSLYAYPPGYYEHILTKKCKMINVLKYILPCRSIPCCILSTINIITMLDLPSKLEGIPVIQSNRIINYVRSTWQACNCICNEKTVWKIRLHLLLCTFNCKVTCTLTCLNTKGFW